MAVGTITLKNLDPALSASEPGVGHLGGLKVVAAQVVPTSGANYTVGGVPITAAQLGLNAILWGDATAVTQAATVGPGESAVLPQADGSILLKCNLAAGSGDNAANANLSACLVNLTVWGY